MPTRVKMRLFKLLLSSLLLAPIALPQGQEIGFVEEYALALDRGKALENLSPGTRDYYFYQCLHLQNAGELQGVPALLNTWIERHGRDQLVESIENRQALLSFLEQPQRTFQYLIRWLGLKFDHKREVPGEASPLPGHLDPALLSLESMTARAFEMHPNSLNGFEDSMLDRLAGRELTDLQLLLLLKRVQRPDTPHLVDLILRQLDMRTSGGFGSLRVHSSLLLEQLEACVEKRPSLLNESAFIKIYLRRLIPNDDVAWRQDPEQRLAYLERLSSFVKRLTPAYNTLKAHVLQHRLMHDLAAGSPDRARFTEFLSLPRRSPYVSQAWLEKRGSRELVVDSGEQLTPLGDPGSAQTLVRAYLEHFFRTDSDWSSFSKYVSESYLNPVFAETKILYGAAGIERWYSMLDDNEAFEELKARVEIEFASTQTTYFEEDEPVALEVNTKNVSTLLVKVFEIDSLAYALAHGKEVDASIDLDGLVAADERTYTYTDHPLLRISRRFDFPQLSRPGVYVVDFIAGGLSSRAVIHKGSLQLRERLGSAGHVFEVTSESGERLAGSDIYLGGRRFAADEGEILVPYSTEPGTKSIILTSGSLVSVTSFVHRSEEYKLRAGAYVDRESLISGAVAPLLLRTSLEINGAPADLSLLENPELTITGVTLDGTRTSIDVRDLKLRGGEDLIHEFSVPPDLQTLEVVLSGTVENLSLGKSQRIRSQKSTFSLSRIDTTTLVHSPILGRDASGYFVNVLGKNGEPVPGKLLSLELNLRGFRDPLQVDLETSATGRVLLGELPAVETVRILQMPQDFGPWQLATTRASHRHTINGRVGQVLRIPHDVTTDSPDSNLVSLLEMRGSNYYADRSKNVTFAGGFAELRGLPAGDYDLLFKGTGQRVAVHITSGERRGNWFVGKSRALERTPASVQLVRAEFSDEGLELELSNSGPRTRVHLIDRHFNPAYEAFSALNTKEPRQLGEQELKFAHSSFNSGREIGEEYRYILARRFAEKFPGNMLSRPGLLLNPWAHEGSRTLVGIGGGAGGQFGGRQGKRAEGMGGASPPPPSPYRHAPGTLANLDFLASPSVVLANLRPRKDGTLRIPFDHLGDGSQLQVIVVDDERLISTSVERAATPLVIRDRRLVNALTPDEHFSEQRRIQFVAKGERTTIRSTTGTRFETYETLADVFQLYRTLNPTAELDRFSFLPRWDKLDDLEKRQRYSEFACHELHLFLYQKDREFFDGIVAPYLANKADKTFLDHWMLGNNLSRYLDPWSFQRLNTLEKILLARRLPGQRKSALRHLQDLFELQPALTTVEKRLFKFALEGSALDSRRSESETDPFDMDLPSGGGPSTPGPSGPGALAESLKALGYVGDEEDQEELRTGSDDFFLGQEIEKNRSRRKNVRALAAGVEPTRIYLEQNYWNRPITSQGPELIGINSFWLDFAKSDPSQPFHSTHFAEASRNLAEMLTALALMDLPFEASDHEFSRKDETGILLAGSPLFLVLKEFAPVSASSEDTALLVGQEIFALNDRQHPGGGESEERQVQDEFLRGVPYGCRVVVTNPAAEPVEMDLMLQIPQGALPIDSSFETIGRNLQLGAYATKKIEYAFYFPQAGTFTHYPAHANQNGELLASAIAATMKVVAVPTTVDTESWEFISQRSNLEALKQFLVQANIESLDLDRLAWRMSQREAFDAVTTLLRDRHTFSETLWSYGLKHQDPGTVREFLRHKSGLVNSCGPWLETPLLSINPIERRSWQRMEFRPLFNPRAHPLGAKHEILNTELAIQYNELLLILAYKPQLADEDWMSVTYHLLLQGRIAEAMTSFNRIDRGNLPMQIQYDYMDAYMDFFTEDVSRAASIAARYVDHPVPRWRERFAEVRAQLAEAAGESDPTAGTSESAGGNDTLVADEPTLEFELKAGRIEVRHAHLSDCELRYYVMDVEFLFSTSPFVQQGTAAFGYVKPSRMDRVSLPTDGSALVQAIPEEFRSTNVLIEVRAAGLVRRQTHFANTLQVQTMDNYGQLRVTDAGSGKPLSSVYVKVFSEEKGIVKFHKDGYTDLRGRFDYTSVSGVPVSDMDRLAILVLDSERGAVIREVKPPAQ
jgi:hypothetical protein